MVLISTWLEWSGIAFRRVDAKRGTRQRFHQQKESIRDDLRLVILFKVFGWFCLVIPHLQVSGLWFCQRIKRHKSTFFCLPADTKLLQRRYHNGLKVCHHLAKFSRPSRHSSVPFSTPAYAFSPIPSTLHQKRYSASSPHNCKLTHR